MVILCLCLCFCVSLGNYWVTEVSFSWIRKAKSVSLWVFFTSDTSLFWWFFFSLFIWEIKSCCQIKIWLPCSVICEYRQNVLSPRIWKQRRPLTTLQFCSKAYVLFSEAGKKKGKNVCVGAACGCALVSAQDLYLAKDDYHCCPLDVFIFDSVKLLFLF